MIGAFSLIIKELFSFHIVAVVFGFLFSIYAFSLLDSFSIPLIFNKRVGLFWKGRQPIYQRIFTNKEAFSVKLDDLKAIQILQKYISDINDYSYEINLVLNNNQRLNIVDHGHEESAFKDAKQLADFLGIPLLKRLSE